MICVANQKGGVGKTTTCVNVATVLSLAGHRVAVVDLDPQGNASTGLGIDHRSLDCSVYDLLAGEASLAEVAVTTPAGLDCLPATPDLSGAEVELVDTPAREFKLAEALGEASPYDVVLVDCPPSLGLLTINALVAATDLLIPVQCEYYALEAVARLLDNADRARRSLNPTLRVAGFVLTMFDRRTRLAVQVADEVRRHFGDLVFDAVVPRSVRLSEAPSFGQPAVTLDPTARGSVAYRAVAAELAARFGLSEVPGQERDREQYRRASIAVGTQVAGRGYGVIAPEPEGIDDAWPRDAGSAPGRDRAMTGQPRTASPATGTTT